MDAPKSKLPQKVELGQTPGIRDSLKMFDYKDCEPWLRNMSEIFDKYGDILRWSFLGNHLFALRNPNHFDYIFKSDNFVKKSDFHRYHYLLMGEGLVTTEGNERWRHKRRAVQPHYTNTRLKGYVGQMVSATQDLINGWSSLAEQGEAFDAQPHMRDITLTINLRCLLVDDFEKHVHEIHKIMDFITEPQGFLDLALPSWFPTPMYFRYRKIINYLDTMVYDIINYRRESGVERSDYLSSLMSAGEPGSPEVLSDRELRDEIITLLVAGHETTSSGLAWALHFLSTHPEIQDQLAEEVDRVLEGREPSFEDLAKLRVAGSVGDEAMRLYPPVMMFMPRYTREDEEIAGVRIPRRSLVFLIPYCAQRHPGFWDEPDVYRPDRFLTEGNSQVHKLAFLPFSAGRRKCAGALFSTYEMKIVLSMIAQRFRLRPKSGHRVEPRMVNGALMPRSGVVVELLPR